MKLPIAERELRVAARTPRTYHARMAGGFIFGLITVWFFWLFRKAFAAGMVPAQTYQFISSLALMTCLFSGNATADAISSEKRNGTLGLLFLTDLKGIDIIAGKL